jgi:transcription elongation factor Elf1
MTTAVDPNETTATCPTCHKEHFVNLATNTSITITCDGCGKILRIERGNGTSVVVREQAPG